MPHGSHSFFRHFCHTCSCTLPMWRITTLRTHTVAGRQTHVLLDCCFAGLSIAQESRRRVKSSRRGEKENERDGDVERDEGEIGSSTHPMVRMCFDRASSSVTLLCAHLYDVQMVGSQPVGGGGELERLGWLGVRVMEPGGF